MTTQMTSPVTSQPVANHRPPPLADKPNGRPRNLKLNFEDGQLQKRIHMFEEISHKDENSNGNGNGNGNGVLCRQPRVVSPEQKRWTQLDITNKEPSGGSSSRDVLRKKTAQQTMHGYNRSPVSAGVQRALVPPRRRVELKVPVCRSPVNGRKIPVIRQDNLSPGAGEDSVRNSVLALVSAFENGKSPLGGPAKNQTKMFQLPERKKTERRNSDTIKVVPNGGTAPPENGTGLLKPPPLHKRKSRSMDSLVQEFETVASELTQTNVKENQEGEMPAPVKPERTFAQDIYDHSKLKPDGQINFDSVRRKRSMKRVTRPRATYEDRNTILFLKESLSNGHSTAADEAHKKQRSQSAKVTNDRAEYEQVEEGFVPGSSCSRNCNHNGEMEREKIDRTPFGFDQGAEFFPASSKDYHNTVVVENNNRSSFLDVLKSPVSRRPKLPTPPPPPMHTALSSSLGDVKSDAAPRFPSPQAKGVVPAALPSDASKLNGISSGNTSNHQLNLGVHTTQDRVEYMSPGSTRRMTDSALIQSLSPRSVRRRGHPMKDNLPAQAEYAEPITIQRSLSDESLETLRRQSPVLDNQGYSVPGSHLLVPSKAQTLRPKSSAKLVVEHRPHSNSISQPILRQEELPPKLPDQPGIVRSRDNGRTADSTNEEGVASHDGRREGGFRQRSKLLTMRRKINDAFRRKHHHQKTEEDRISVTSEGSDTEVNEQVLKKRLTQVRAMRLRSSVYCTMQPRLTSQYSKLYEYAVIVSLQMNEETRRYEPYEMRRFPYEVSDSQTDKLRAIPQFCFPDAFKWAPVDQYNSESFCFVLTSSDGSRLYGYNRRFLPPGDGPRLPEVVCVMSPIGCYPIYNQLLDEIENRRKSSMSAVENLLKLCNEAPFPRPGSHTKVTTPAPQTRRRNHFTLHNYEHKPLILQRPQDQRLEHVDFDTLFNCLSVNRIVQIFASLLLERRVIMCSGKLSKLSRCSQALVGLLYPFSWQHVYVPVLPEKLIDMCCSPTPYIMGMLSLCIPRLEEMPLEEVLIVDLDSRDFYTMVGDEETILPKKLTLALERALKVCSMSSWEGADTDDELSEDHEAKNSAISEAFIRFFVETVGHYSNHFTQQFDGEQKFDREGFVKAVSSKSVRNFLEVFSETQMFSLFIQEKETESEGISQGLFERRVREFENELKSNSKNISAKMKKFGKAVKEIKDSGLKLAESAKGVKMRMKHNLDDRI